jgi:hypothetical protein
MFTWFFFETPINKKPLIRNRYINGDEFLKSSENQDYYSLKLKSESMEDFFKLKPNFSVRKQLNISIDTFAKYDVIKLLANKDSRFYVASFESLKDCTNINGIIIPMYEN